ncbi:MAG: HNH endonuclease [Imperialibacter sp.]|uniref:HNH endonuclease n=1 Tax=Imperialibacter sp. TaxID=2038411 RepID=UPI003A87019A
MKRKKIPPVAEAEVMFKSALQCCICQEKGDHIHHLDGDPSNNTVDNLVLLCFRHHDEATVIGSLRKKLSHLTILNYRKHHYQVVESSRERQLGKFDSSLETLTEERLLFISKNAVIIIELEKIKEEYFGANWDERNNILERLNKFANHSNPRLALDIFEFLSLIAGQTQSGMTYSLATSVFGIVLNFFPPFYDEEKRPQAVELAKMCIHLGYNIAYDSFIHLRNIAIAMWGLTIIKYIYRSAKEYTLTELVEEVNRSYNELESILKRSEEKGLEDAQEMMKIFRADLNNAHLAFPMLTPHLMKRLEIDNIK